MNNLTILFEDEHIIVCEKPAGVPVQTKSFGVKDMESLLRNHLASTGQKPFVGVIHRLDQPVSGVLVFAKTPQIAAKLNNQMQANGFQKYYQAVVCGTLPAESGTLRDYLVKDGRTNTSRICTKQTAGAKSSHLDYRVLKISSDCAYSVVQVKLGTGRHHQIRVQMAGQNAPLWGDNKYNPAFTQKGGYSPIALRAYRLDFTHPVSGKQLSFELSCDWSHIFV